MIILGSKFVAMGHEVGLILSDSVWTELGCENDGNLPGGFTYHLKRPDEMAARCHSVRAS